MHEIMNDHYNLMKEKVGIQSVIDTSESDEETEKIFKKLRPQSPYKMRDLIRNDFDPRQYNRKIGLTGSKLT